LTSYIPGIDDASLAQLVTLASSGELSGIDISMVRGQRRTARVRGVILNSAGEPTTGGRVEIVSNHASIGEFSSGATLSNDGAFEFTNVPPGQYVIQVDHGKRDASTEGDFGALPVTVEGRDISGLVVRVSDVVAIQGRLTIRARNPANSLAPARIEISATPVDVDDGPTQWASASPDSDGHFEMKVVPGMRRLQVLSPPAGWIVESVRVNGAEMTDTPVALGSADAPDIEVVMTDRAASIVGSVVDESDHRAAGLEVLVYPANRDDRYLRSRYFARTKSGADGTFTIAALPAGSYYAVAVATPPDWEDTQTLESLEGLADAVTLREFGTVSVRLRLARP
jgi:hypothetical protein